MAEQTESRFQFSLVDILVAIASLALATLYVSIDPKNDPLLQDAQLRVFIASLLGAVAALLHRRVWRSQSPWFIPPFVLAGFCMALLAYQRMPQDIAMAVLLAGYAVLFVPTVVLFHTKKQKYPVPWLFSAGAFFMVALFSLSQVTPVPARGRANLQFQSYALTKFIAKAQTIYIRMDHDGDGVMEYAPTITALVETKPGARDLEYVQHFVTTADATLGKPQKDYRGYYFKILTAQGANATGGAKTYIDANGNLTGGFAIAAYPARYGATGNLTFIINERCEIHFKDLGPKTISIAEKMTLFDPDTSWEKE